MHSGPVTHQCRYVRLQRQKECVRWSIDLGTLWPPERCTGPMRVAVGTRLPTVELLDRNQKRVLLKTLMTFQTYRRAGSPVELWRSDSFGFVIDITIRCPKTMDRDVEGLNTQTRLTTINASADCLTVVPRGSHDRSF